MNCLNICYLYGRFIAKHQFNLYHSIQKSIYNVINTLSGRLWVNNHDQTFGDTSTLTYGVCLNDSKLKRRFPSVVSKSSIPQFENVVILPSDVKINWILTELPNKHWKHFLDVDKHLIRQGNSYQAWGGQLAALGPHVASHIIFNGPRKHSEKFFKSEISSNLSQYLQVLRLTSTETYFSFH